MTGETWTIIDEYEKHARRNGAWNHALKNVPNDDGIVQQLVDLPAAACAWGILAMAYKIARELDPAAASLGTAYFAREILDNPGAQAAETIFRETGAWETLEMLTGLIYKAIKTGEWDAWRELVDAWREQETE